MDYTFHIPEEIYHDIITYATQNGQTPDELVVALIADAVVQLKHTDSYAAVRLPPYDPASDPLAPFIGAFDSGVDEPGWVEKHDIYFSVDNGEQHDH